MDWWTDLGAYFLALNPVPALAVDMATKAPGGDLGFLLANSMNQTQAPLDVYPQDTMGA